MAWEFKGEATNKVDTKGRVSVPASYRPVILAGDPECVDGKNPRFVLVYGLGGDDCLNGYTITEAGALHAKIQRLPYGPDRKLAERRFHAQSSYMTVDHNGRIVIPAHMREKFGITGQAFFSGMGAHFQIWEPGAYEADMEALEAAASTTNTLELLNNLPPLEG